MIEELEKPFAEFICYLANARSFLDGPNVPDEVFAELAARGITRADATQFVEAAKKIEGAFFDAPKPQ